MIKKLFLLSMIVATSFCATAKQFDFLASGMMNTDGTVLDGGKVYFYVNDGGSTPKNVYLDYLEATVATQPIRLDDSGMPYDYPSGTTPIAIYGDGTYRVVVKDSNDVTLYTWTGINSQAQVDFGGLYVDIATRYGTNTTAMQNAITAYATTNATFLFNSSTFTATSALNFPSNITMKFINGGKISVSNGIAVTVNRIEASSYQIFDGTGIVNIVTANNPVILDAWKTGTGLISQISTVSRILQISTINNIDTYNGYPFGYFPDFGNSTLDYVVTAGTSVTLSGEAWYRNLTIQTGATLNVTPLSAGGMGYYTIRVNGTFTLSGNINGVGAGQSGSAGGASVGGEVNGNPGVTITVYTIGAIGGTGGSGGCRADSSGSTTGGGGAILYYYDQTFARTLAGGVSAGPGNVAGNAGNSGVSVSYGLGKRLEYSYPRYGSGGTGGSSGTGDNGGTGEAGGNGGNGGANVNIIAKTLVSSASATIDCSGTAGSAGAATASSIDGSGGGGGGGAGGFVSLRYKTLLGTLPTINVAGGAAGAAGSVAAGGQVGAAGGAGVTGNYEVYQL